MRWNSFAIGRGCASLVLFGVAGGAYFGAFPFDVMVAMDWAISADTWIINHAAFPGFFMLFMVLGLLVAAPDVAKLISFVAGKVWGTEKTKRRVIRERIGDFLERGNVLLVECTNESAPPPVNNFSTWTAEVSEFLTRNLGAAYAARFVSPSGLPLTITSIFSEQHRNVWGAVMVRNARLHEFLRELGQ